MDRRTGSSRPTATVAAAALALALLLAASTALATGQVGEPAADFSLQDTDNVTHTLQQYRGEVVLLFMVGYG